MYSLPVLCSISLRAMLTGKVAGEGCALDSLWSSTKSSP